MMSNTAFSIAKEVRAHFFFSENGGRCLSRAAFPHGCMLGLHLHLPRALGVRSVEATLTDPSGRGKMPLSFTLVGTHGGLEEYAALLDTGASGLGLGAVSLAITLMCPFGKLFVSERVGQSLVFRSDACGSVAFLLFRTAGEGSGGGVFLLPYEELRHTGAICRGEDGDYDRFFAYLAAHGVHLLLLCLPIGGDAREKEGALSLSPDVRAAAEAHGVVCLLDLLPFVSLHKEGRLQAPGDPVGYRLCDEPGGAFPPIEIADPMPPERLCGEGGVLARLLDGGYGGAFLRYADRFADSFLFAVRAELTARAPTSLFYVCTERGALEGAPVGYRRRFCEPPFDGLVCSSLQEALASYLSRGDTGGLSRFFDGYIGALPAPLAKRSIALLGEPRGRTLHARIGTALPHEEGERADALARLGELIAATLPGLSHLPMPEAGEEERLAFRLRLFGICRKEKAILSGAFRLHILSPELLVFSRTVEGQMLITVCNRSAKTLAISCPDGFSVLIGGRGRKLLYRLPPNSGTILRVDLFAGERTALSFHHLQSVSRDTRFAPRTASPAAKSS